MNKKEIFFKYKQKDDELLGKFTKNWKVDGEKYVEFLWINPNLPVKRWEDLYEVYGNTIRKRVDFTKIKFETKPEFTDLWYKEFKNIQEKFVKAYMNSPAIYTREEALKRFKYLVLGIENDPKIQIKGKRKLKP